MVFKNRNMNTRTMKPQNPTNTLRSEKILFKKIKTLWFLYSWFWGLVPKVIQLLMRSNTVISGYFLKGTQSLRTSENVATHFLVQLKEQNTPISPPKAWFIYHHELDSSCTSKSSIWSCNLTHTCDLSTWRTTTALCGKNVQKRPQDRIFGKFLAVS